MSEQIAEAIMTTIVAANANPDDIVRALGNVLAWHLKRMPKDTAKASLGYVFNVLAANGFLLMTSSDVGHG
jgi:hypothetical protein